MTGRNATGQVDDDRMQRRWGVMTSSHHVHHVHYHLETQTRLELLVSFLFFIFMFFFFGTNEYFELLLLVPTDSDGDAGGEGDNDRGGKRRLKMRSRASSTIYLNINLIMYITFVKTNLSRFLDRTEPQKTAENRFIAVSVQFYEISKILGPVLVLVHPKSGKKPDRTGPLNPR